MAPSRAKTDQLLPSEELVLRLATPDDIPSLQKCNRAVLPENYPDKFYNHYITNFPDLTVVAESSSLLLPDRHQQPTVVAYALGCIVEKPYAYESSPHWFSESQKQQLIGFHQGRDVCPRISYGHTISLAVAPSHRRMGLASMLLQYLHSNMRSGYGAMICDLSVRVSNDNAVRLYEREGYNVAERLLDYYKIGIQEDGYNMQKDLSSTIDDDGDDDGDDDDDLSTEMRLPRQLFVFRENAPAFGQVHRQRQEPVSSSSPNDFYFDSSSKTSIFMEHLNQF